jgi:ABC-2 type transport system ATP-binding protein
METVLEVRDVRHRYGATVALDGIDLEVGAGECVALLGPNGAGKTTLVNLAVGLLHRQAGTIRVAGSDPRDAATRRRLGVVQQELGYPTTLKVGELVAGAAVRGGGRRSATGPVLAELHLTDLAGRRAAKLSGGQRQRLQLAMALVNDPALLILDEPTAGLDVNARAALWRVLAQRRARGTGVLVTTHLIEETSTVADRVVVLDHGRILAADRPDALVARLPDRTVIARTTLSQAELAALPGAVSVELAGDRAHIATRTPEELLRVLLAADPGLSDLRVEGARLEDAVAGLTNHATEEVPA